MRVSKATEAATVLGIIAVICATYLVGYLISWLLTAVTGYSLTFQLPLVARAFGGILVLLGVAVSGSTMTVRKAREVLDSTSVTLLKLVRGAPLESRGARTESFVPKGPYCWVRNPMYSGVVLSLFGLGVLFSSALILLWGVVVMCYFLLFLIPFEERELDALFGESYREYKRLVPELFPTGRRFRAQTSQ
jgi:protein-S-isoprenylcysteine O-methyltransferase Ste14